MCKDNGEDIRKSNPSPGNKASGITTLEEKSLGCIHKSGTKPFMGVYKYGQMIDRKGLVFMDGTAYDVASVVSLAAGGAQVVAFTTGMGTPVGNAIAPVIKITGNKDTASRLSDMIDFDTSTSISGEKTVDELGTELLDYVVRVCNGEEVIAEVNGFSDMAINQFYSYS
ncbi:MAG: altronate dehydratase, partial [Bacillota bacterium]